MDHPSLLMSPLALVSVGWMVERYKLAMYVYVDTDLVREMQRDMGRWR